MIKAYHGHHGHADNFHGPCFFTNQQAEVQWSGTPSRQGTPVHTTSKPSQKSGLLDWQPIGYCHTHMITLARMPWQTRSGKFMIQLDTGENQVSGWSVLPGCRLAGSNENGCQDWSNLNAAKNHFIQPSICFQNKATNRNNRKGDNDNWPRTGAPNVINQDEIWEHMSTHMGKTLWQKSSRMPNYQPKALTPLELLKSSWDHSVEEKSSLARPMAAHWHATSNLNLLQSFHPLSTEWVVTTCAVITNWGGMCQCICGIKTLAITSDGQQTELPWSPLAYFAKQCCCPGFAIIPSLPRFWALEFVGTRNRKHVVKKMIFISLTFPLIAPTCSTDLVDPASPPSISACGRVSSTILFWVCETKVRPRCSTYQKIVLQEKQFFDLKFIISKLLLASPQFASNCSQHHDALSSARQG